MAKGKGIQNLRTQRSEEKKNFQRIFLGMFFSMLTVILIAAGVGYRAVKDVLVEQNSQRIMETFSRVQENFEDINASASKIAVQVMLDEACEPYLTAVSEKSFDEMDVRKAIVRLSRYQGINSMVESIYLYNKKLGKFLSSISSECFEGFSDKNILEILEQPEKYEMNSLIRREKTIKYGNGVERAKTVYSYILYSSKRGDPGNVVIINLDLSEMIGGVFELDSMKDSWMLIVDQNENQVLDVKTSQIEATGPLKNQIQEMIDKNQPYSEIKSDGEKYFISHLYSEKTGWRYVKITRWESVFEVLDDISRGVRLLVAVLVLAVLGVAFGNSVSVWKFHRKLEKKHVVKVHRSEKDRLKEIFLSDFLHGRKLFSKKQLKEELETWKWTFSEEKKYVVLILQLLNYPSFQEVYGKKGTYTMKYGFQNIFEEIFSAYFQITGLINRDQTLTFLLEIPETLAEDDKLIQMKIGECFEKFCEKEQIFIPWQFFCVGNLRPVSLEKVPEANECLKSVVKEGFFYPPNTYCTEKELLRQHGKHADIKKLNLKRLANAVHSEQDLRRLYAEMKKEMEGCRTEEYMNVMVWMGITVLRSATAELSADDEETNQFLTQITKCEKITQVDELYDQLFAKIYGCQKEAVVKKGVSGRMDEVKKYIRENYTDPNLTVDGLGDVFGVSPGYLGRLFKKDTGMSVSEFINGERLKKVLEELEHTNNSAKDIAEKYGFVSVNNFYTYFHKKIGLTPQAYRESRQKRECQKENVENQSDCKIL